MEAVAYLARSERRERANAIEQAGDAVLNYCTVSMMVCPGSPKSVM